MCTWAQCCLGIPWMHYRHLLSTRHWEFTTTYNHHKAKQGRSAPSSTFFKCLSTLDCLFTCKREAIKMLFGIDIFGWRLQTVGQHQDGQQAFPSRCEFLQIFILEQFSERGSSNFLPGGYNISFQHTKSGKTEGHCLLCL